MFGFLASSDSSGGSAAAVFIVFFLVAGDKGHQSDTFRQFKIR